MNYKKIYDQIINHRKNNIPEGYKERHHIVPRSLGGTDDTDNLIYLTAKEHFICHYLLSKMYAVESFEWYKMNHAFIIMKTNTINQNRYFNSRLYESRRSYFAAVMSKAQSGKKNSQFGTRWIHCVSKQESRKIAKDLPLPNGWAEGRKINWQEKIGYCKCCNREYKIKTKEYYCSKECKEKLIAPSFIGREHEFIELYKIHKSLNKTLQSMGYPGAISHYYKWAKKVLDSM